MFFFISIRFLKHCSVCLSVCLVLWASLPEIKIDDDDDDDNTTAATKLSTVFLVQCVHFSDVFQKLIVAYNTFRKPTGR